jgi:hypothetical protein
MDDFLFQQWYSVIDARTTICCLLTAGQIRKADAEFDTPNGAVTGPPAHWGCRAKLMPWMPGFLDGQRKNANKELQLRPIEQRRRGPNGEVGVPAQAIPPKLVMAKYPVPNIPKALLRPKPGGQIVVPPNLPGDPEDATDDGV